VSCPQPARPNTATEHPIVAAPRNTSLVIVHASCVGTSGERDGRAPEVLARAIVSRTRARKTE
jgi:hypothetical protein